MNNAEIVSTIQANLSDKRMYGIQLFIERLLTRTHYGNGIEQYRVRNKTTNALITNLAGLSAAIAADKITASFPYNGEGMSSDRVVGFDVTLSNLQVEFSPHADDDAFFSQYYSFDKGQKYGFMFHIAYMNDGDETVPLKVYYVRLVRL